MAASPPADNLPLPPLPDEKFGVISIDIPWHFRSRAPTQNHHISRSPQRHYPTMDLEHAEQLPIKHLAKPDARSEEHTSELQSLMRISYAVFCLKKTKYYDTKSQLRQN